MDYFDPNSNAETFTTQPGQFRRRQGQDARLAQCLGHAGTDKKTKAALLEKDAAKRAAMYQELAEESPAKPARSSSSSSRRKWPATARTSRTSSSGRASTPTSSADLQGIDPAGSRSLEHRSKRRRRRGAASAARTSPFIGGRAFSGRLPSRPISGFSPSPSSSAASCRSIRCWPSLGDRAPAHVVERHARELGLDLPLYQQFFIYVRSALTGDFGTSVLTTQPGHDRHPPRLSGDDGTGDARHHHRRRCSAFRSACWPRSSAAASSTRSCASSA